MPPSQALTYTRVQAYTHTPGSSTHPPAPPSSLALALASCSPVTILPRLAALPLVEGAARRQKAAPSGPRMIHVHKERLDGGWEHLGDTAEPGGELLSL